MSKSVMLFGYGRMGQVALKFLVKLGYKVVVVDERVPKPNEISSAYNVTFVEGKSKDAFKYLTEIYAPHLAISTLPYTCNVELAELCIPKGIGYIDLGGCVDNTNRIFDISRNHPNVPVFTDLGLAPGLINILAEYYVKSCKQKEKPYGVLAAVGGIPIVDDDYPFNYHCTWSLEGLYNEYTDDCECLVSGWEKKLPALHGHEFIYLDSIGQKAEAFLTSGASAHSIETMKNLGIKNFKYKTLRYIGHRNFIRSIIEEGTKENFLSIVKRLSETAPYKEDCVIGLVKLYNQNEDDIDKKEFSVVSNKEMTAMQRATAGPLCVAASMILDCYLPNTYLSYWDIVNHMAYFKCKLKELCQINISI